MARAFLVVAGAILVVVIVGMLALGLFPPHPAAVAVQHVLPNDRFAPSH